MVRLLAVERENLPKFLGWVNDPEVTQFLMVDPPLGMEQEEAWFEGLRDREAMVFTIQTMEGEVIGNCGLEKISWKDRKATRQRKFDRLHKAPRDSSKAAKVQPKAGGK